jgi:UDP-N-acetylmuramate: L-alanyl-gamma-D-glutamyl-meso-diaminopimelate ligase
MHYHFIAIGGSAMHNLAIALHQKGVKVTGSDDEIFEPSRSRLKKYGLLPEHEGWHPEIVTNAIDAVVLGMHAKADNPELLKAQQLGITIYSYPEFLYNQTQDKTRVVIGGSHGKTTTTAMVMHVLKTLQIPFDYMVGARVKGFDTMVGLSNEAKISVFEGDEYLTSPIDPRPKFHLYKPHIGLITGIAWDHINVFPTFENYVWQFEEFARLIEPNGSLVYFKGDEHLKQVADKARKDIKRLSYQTLPYKIKDGITYLINNDTEIALSIFGEHNLQNLAGAMQVCLQLGIKDDDFYQAIASFEGAERRLQLLHSHNGNFVFHDFAHSPSKLKATVEAVKRQFADKKIIACMELHTYSSLNNDFLGQYNGTMEDADVAMVYFSQHAIELKKLKNISIQQVENAFGKSGLKAYNQRENLITDLKKNNFNNSVILFLSSGDFSGIDLKDLAINLIGQE